MATSLELQISPPNDEGPARDEANEPKDLSKLTNEELDELVDDCMKELSETLWFKIYLFFMASLSIVEAILVGYGAYGSFYTAQVIIFVASTFIFLIGNYFITQAVVSKGLTYNKALNALITPGETKFEVVCFIIGWACLFTNRGLATLRIFRVVRVLWYLELHEADEDAKYFVIFRKGGGLVIQYLERIGNELFSTHTRGGTVVLAIYFYTIYVFAVVYWNEIGIHNYNSTTTTWYNANTNQQACISLSTCYITLMRLSLYDGNGFDFVSNMCNSPWKGLAVLLIVFLCFTAIALLNGLIGIFGAAFTSDEDDEDDEDEDEEKEDKKGDDDEKKDDKEGGDDKEPSINDVWNRLERIEMLLLAAKKNTYQ